MNPPPLVLPTGMGLLYYGQNFLIYPSAFPAGARESEFLSPPLPRLALTTHV